MQSCLQSLHIFYLNDAIHRKWKVQNLLHSSQADLTEAVLTALSEVPQRVLDLRLYQIHTLFPLLVGFQVGHIFYNSDYLMIGFQSHSTRSSCNKCAVGCGVVIITSLQAGSME